jgi:hypothetical protein
LIRRLNSSCNRSIAFVVGSKGVMNWVESEVSLGLSRAVADSSFPFIPILAQKSTGSALPPFAGLYHAVRDPLNDPAEMEKLLKAVLGPGGPVAILGEPFVGLRAMTESDADRFFGRTMEINDLIGKLANSRLMAVVADSGSGKSSLVLAGLVPKFRGGVFADPAQQEPAGRIWHVVTVHPGSAPFDNLRKAMTMAAERLSLSPKEKAELGELIDPSKPQQTAYALQCNLPAATTETLLVIDQFEELFTQTPERMRAPFIDWLLSLVASGAPLGFRVVLTIRSDYFNLCSTHPALFDLLKQDNVNFRLKQITSGGLSAIVHEPLRMAGHKDQGEQHALLAHIRRDVSDRPGDLALIQMALFETWKQHKLDKSRLLEAYTKVGGVSGALAHAAEEVRTKRLDTKQQNLLEPVLVRLINLGDTGGATRRVAGIHEFDDSRGDLVRMLSEERCSRLLLLGTNSVELCHEQLITQWPWLQSRITESAVYVRRLSRLIEKVGEWKQAEHEDRVQYQYLATGAELEVFDDLRSQHGDWLSPTEAEYVVASKNARQREEQRRVWLFRGVAAASFLFFIAAVVADLFYVSANKQTRIAKEQTRIAKEQTERADLAKADAEANLKQTNSAKSEAVASLEQAKAAKSEAVDNFQALQKAQSRHLAILANQTRSQGKGATAVLLALEGLTSSSNAEPRPLVVQAEQALFSAVQTPKEWARLSGHTGEVTGAVFSPDSKLLLTIGEDGNARVWDVSARQTVRVLQGHTSSINSAAFSPDGSLIVTGSSDRTAKVWNAMTGREITTLRHDEPVRMVAFTVSGSRLMTMEQKAQPPCTSGCFDYIVRS